MILSIRLLSESVGEPIPEPIILFVVVGLLSHISEGSFRLFNVV